MSFDYSNFHVIDWGLRLGWFGGGSGETPDLMLWQGDCDDCDVGERYVRLSSAHFPLIAKELQLLTPEEAGAKAAYWRDRFDLLAALVRSQCPTGSPLRAALDALVEGQSATAQQASRPAAAAPSGDLFGGGT
jgi:hypothetical protein